MPTRGRLAVLATLALAAAGCGAAHPSPASITATSLPACRAPEPAVLPHTAGSLSQSDTGAFCLASGQVLDVFLTAPNDSAPHTRWGKISTADTSVLGYGNSGVLTPPVNVTAGVFKALSHGATTLTSTLPNGTAWRVTIVVT